MTRDHGGGVDAAIARFGGDRIAWADLSTGINPHPYPLPALASDAWSALPDTAATDHLVHAARAFWRVPDALDILPAPGASALIAALPPPHRAGRVVIPKPTYNEHAAAFGAAGWDVASDGTGAARVIVHPNNPDGRIWTAADLPAGGAELTVIDESFCDTVPELSLVTLGRQPGTLVLKSFGKFWGLAGLRLGFAIGRHETLAPLRARMGPWAVSGPALQVGAMALRDWDWAEATRQRLAEDTLRLDALMIRAGAQHVGGTSLFRLYDVGEASLWQTRLARHRIWSRTFPYAPNWLRLGLPHSLHWPRLEAALA